MKRSELAQNMGNCRKMMKGKVHCGCRGTVCRIIGASVASRSIVWRIPGSSTGADE